MKLQDAAILVLHVLRDKSREEAGTKNDRDTHPGQSFLSLPAPTGGIGAGGDEAAVDDFFQDFHNHRMM